MSTSGDSSLSSGVISHQMDSSNVDSPHNSKTSQSVNMFAPNKNKVRATWIGTSDLVAVINGGDTCRIVQVGGDDTYSITVPQTEDVRMGALDFQSTVGILAVGTDTGYVVMWKWKPQFKGRNAWEVR